MNRVLSTSRIVPKYKNEVNSIQQNFTKRCVSTTLYVKSKLYDCDDCHTIINVCSFLFKGIPKFVTKNEFYKVCKRYGNVEISKNCCCFDV
jgi:hypothetical protein